MNRDVFVYANGMTLNFRPPNEGPKVHLQSGALPGLGFIVDRNSPEHYDSRDQSSFY